MSGYRRILAENGIIQSMPRKGNCLDSTKIKRTEFDTISLSALK